jgi:lysophospholipase L1-like esterase
VRWVAAASILLLCGLGSRILAQEKKAASKWENAIRAFEDQDKKSPPPKHALLFVGSSSIRMWDLPKYFPNLPVINRGFGGSHISDSVEFTSRIVIPYQPQIIVFYAGDNDLNFGKSPETVLKDFQAFVKGVHDRLPDTRIIFIAIKPSPARWLLAEKQREANRLIRAFIETDKRLDHVDVEPAMLGADGKPRAELFVKDQLHLNDAGYKLWTSLLMPHIEKAAPAK